MSSTVSQLMCVTADAGLPIFTRTIGNEEPLPYPIMGSLNGVDMFSRNHGVEIVNTRAGKAKITWKIYKGSLKLIAISKEPNVSDFQMHILLDNIFNALVLTVGLSEIEVIKNVDKLKREVRGSVCIVDGLIKGTVSFGSITQSVDIILCNDTILLQDCLDGFVSACDSEFGCLLVHGKIVVATEKWWQLLPMETMLLILLVRSVPEATARDFPIYLPHGSPNVPHRLLTIEIMEGIEVCVICGPEPLLRTVLDNHVIRYWQSRKESLRSCQMSHPRNLPPNFKLDNQINGFILVNIEDGKCLSSIDPCGSMSGSELMDADRRREVLTHFYLSIVGETFSSGDDIIENIRTDYKFRDDIEETYVCADQYKLFATQFDDCQLFILFSKDIPIYAMPTYAQTFKQIANLISQ